jgi:hypothetical protein
MRCGAVLRTDGSNKILRFLFGAYGTHICHKAALFFNYGGLRALLERDVAHGILRKKKRRGNSAPCSLLVLLRAIVTSVETINTAAGVNQLLFAGIERVAFGTNFHADVFAGRTGMDYLAASARDRCVNVLGMNACLQPMSPLLL